ncbi:uncharacterized protein LOC129598780 isoform X2 [Paramacrobiotus metropolitanus]|uniref:uncharacterized protein LOC129598780 isoform X2 n=1 Tax=Paramacrobiotus metropolitanus TaxID=2943436 RepID=UPI0024457F7E|nr:uncharacterized protein LOC129598780 isoform X2 [Paramacrobiotus metropolitanus]
MFDVPVIILHFVCPFLFIRSGNANIRALSQIVDVPHTTPPPETNNVVNKIPGTTTKFCNATGKITKPVVVDNWDVETTHNISTSSSLTLNYTINDAGIEDDSEWLGYYSYPAVGGVRFYMNITEKADFYLNSLMKTRRGLQIPDFVGVHQVALQPYNASVKQLEDALSAAWSKNLDGTSSTWNPVQIIFIDNGTVLSTLDGSPLVQVVYVLPVRSKIGDVNTRIYSDDTALNQLSQADQDPPSVEDLQENLQKIGVSIASGAVVYGYARFTGYLRPADQSHVADMAPMYRELLEIATEEAVRRGCGSPDSGDLDIQFGTTNPWIMTSRANGSFSYSTLTVIPSAVLVHKTIYLGEMPYLPFHHKYGTQFFESQSVGPSFINGTLPWPVDKTYSFRMYVNMPQSNQNNPLNIQLLPRLEEQMTERLQKSLDDASLKVAITLWNPELVGNAINFFVSVYVPDGFTIVTADPSLTYAEAIYDKLQGLTVEVPVPSLNINLTYILQKYPFGEVKETMTESQVEQWYQSAKQSIIKGCTAGRNPFELCPVNETFTLYVQSLSKQRASGPYEFRPAATFVNSSLVLHAVEQAFAQANPITTDDITLTITLTGREELKTVEWNDATKFVFAATYPGMESHKYWTLWRYPAVEILNKFLNETATARLTTSWTFKAH